MCLQQVNCKFNRTQQHAVVSISRVFILSPSLQHLLAHNSPLYNMKAVCILLLSLIVVTLPSAHSDPLYPLVASFFQQSNNENYKRARTNPITSCPVSHCASNGMLCGSQKDSNGQKTSTTGKPKHLIIILYIKKSMQSIQTINC